MLDRVTITDDLHYGRAIIRKDVLTRIRSDGRIRKEFISKFYIHREEPSLEKGLEGFVSVVLWSTLFDSVADSIRNPPLYSLVTAVHRDNVEGKVWVEFLKPERVGNQSKGIHSHPDDTVSSLWDFVQYTRSRILPVTSEELKAIESSEAARGWLRTDYSSGHRVFGEAHIRVSNSLASGWRKRLIAEKQKGVTPNPFVDSSAPLSGMDDPYSVETVELTKCSCFRRLYLNRLSAVATQNLPGLAAGPVEEIRYWVWQQQENYTLEVVSADFLEKVRTSTQVPNWIKDWFENNRQVQLPVSVLYPDINVKVPDETHTLRIMKKNL